MKNKSFHKRSISHPSLLIRSILSFFNLNYSFLALILFTLLFSSSELFTSCQKADNIYYTGARVSFTYTYTNTVPELNAALGGFGEFCTIRMDGANFIFT
ncbi:MAG: hypothetical protein IJ209_08740, partial [Bacteroidaceae bacterium]|nr:hypothetical protein [Bacteroidaceae bacterium]